MEKIRNGIVIKLPDGGLVKENSLIRRICDQIKNSLPLGYKLFIVEISEKDLESDLEVGQSEKERLFYYLDDLDIRIAIYLKTKNHIISTDPNSKKNAKQEILKIGSLIEEIDGGRFDIPLTKIFETSTRILSCARFRFRSSNLLSVSVDLRVIEEKAETWKASSLTFHGDDLGIPQIVNFNDCSCRIVMSLQTREILILEIDLLKKLTSPFYMSSEL